MGISTGASNDSDYIGGSDDRRAYSDHPVVFVREYDEATGKDRIRHHYELSFPLPNNVLLELRRSGNMVTPYVNGVQVEAAHRVSNYTWLATFSEESNSTDNVCDPMDADIATSYAIQDLSSNLPYQGCAYGPGFMSLQFYGGGPSLIPGRTCYHPSSIRQATQHQYPEQPPH
jgi:hypothetical protein